MNTTTHRGRVVATLLTTVLLGACEFISPTETNPNAVPTATVDQLFTGIQVNTFFVAEGQISRIASLWTQQMAGTDRQFAIIDTYRLNEEDADGEFSAIYTGGGLIDLKTGIAQAEEAGRSVYAGILKIHEAYMFGMAASMFGDIPYSEAANTEFETPALDDQAQVYTAVQALLDQAISDLASGQGSGPGGTCTGPRPTEPVRTRPPCRKRSRASRRRQATGTPSTRRRPRRTTSGISSCATGPGTSPPGTTSFP